MSRVPWEILAWEGFCMSDSGSLDRPLPTTSWLVPDKIELDNGLLRWTLGMRRKAKRATSGEGMLDDFLDLAIASEEEVVSYARKWGTLVAVRPNPDRLSLFRMEGTEPLDLWRSTVDYFVSILRIAIKVQRGEPTVLEDWHPLASLDFVSVGAAGAPGAPLHGPNTVSVRSAVLEGTRTATVGTGDFDQHLLAALVSGWLAQAPSPVQMVWKESGQAAIEFAPQSLLSALVLQLAFVVARTDGVATCASCGVAFSPKRRPAPGRRSYCQKCGLRAARRDASRAYRLRLARS